MLSHLRSNLLLLVLTVALCCVVYPVILLVIGQTVFRDKAQGSLILDKDGKAIGSSLIAQPFTGEGYFQPFGRVGNARLRCDESALTITAARPCAHIGPIVKYGGAKRNLGPDVEPGSSLTSTRKSRHQRSGRGPFHAGNEPARRTLECARM